MMQFRLKKAKFVSLGDGNGIRKYTLMNQQPSKRKPINEMRYFELQDELQRLLNIRHDELYELYLNVKHKTGQDAIDVSLAEVARVDAYIEIVRDRIEKNIFRKIIAWVRVPISMRIAMYRKSKLFKEELKYENSDYAKWEARQKRIETRKLKEKLK